MVHHFASQLVIVHHNALSIISNVHGTTVELLTTNPTGQIVIDVNIDQDDPEHEALQSDFEE